jgi:cell division protein FtsA
MKRSKAPDLVVGLDVGTTKVCAIITEPGPRGVLNVLGVGTAPSRGLRRGIVVNIDSTVEAIKAAIAEAELMAHVEVAGVRGIGGGHIRGVISRGVAGITGKNHEVGDADVERVIRRRGPQSPQDREIIHLTPQSFTVDDGDGVGGPSACRACVSRSRCTSSPGRSRRSRTWCAR